MLKNPEMKQNRDTFWENIFHEKCPVPLDGGFNIKPAPPIPGMKKPGSPKIMEVP